MKTSTPFYKIIISYFEVVENEKNEREVELIFRDENPFLSRSEAIERFNSYVEIFSEEKEDGNIKNWLEILKSNVETFTIPTLNLYFCQYENQENDMVLFGSLLENFEERIEELVDEHNFYSANNFDNIETQRIEDLDGNKYLVLKNSLFQEDDKKFLKN